MCSARASASRFARQRNASHGPDDRAAVRCGNLAAIDRLIDLARRGHTRASALAPNAQAIYRSIDRARPRADVSIGADRGTDQSIRRSIDRLMWCARGYARTSASTLTDRAIDQSDNRSVARCSSPAAASGRRDRRRSTERSIDPTIDRSIDAARPRLRVVVGIGAN